jgi:hypothetical protein
MLDLESESIFSIFGAMMNINDGDSDRIFIFIFLIS